MRGNVLVTGASGFVGKPLCLLLEEEGYNVRRVLRSVDTTGSDVVSVGDIGPETNWEKALCGIDIVVHLANRSHPPIELSANPESEFWKTNVDGTIALGRQAVEAGVKRFVYISSVKVNGEVSGEQPFDENSAPAPLDLYGKSKWKAETELLAITTHSEMETVIVRPPLVYGPGAKANFLAIMHATARRYPLPVGAACNKRSMVSVANLTDFILLTIEHPKAGGEIYMVADGEDMTVAELTTRLAVVLSVKSNIYAVPYWLLNGVARIFGRSQILDKLFGRLQVSIIKARTQLGWNPPCTVTQGLTAAAAWYRAEFGGDEL